MREVEGFNCAGDILESFGFRADSCRAKLGVCAMCGPWEHREHTPVENRNPIKSEFKGQNRGIK